MRQAIYEISSKPFSAPEVPHVRASSAALDGRTSRTSRRSHDTRYSFPHDPRTIESRSQSIPCWPFLSRETQVHRPNFSFPRLRIAPAWGVVYDSNSAQANTHSSICISACTAVLLLRHNGQTLATFR